MTVSSGALISQPRLMSKGVIIIVCNSIKKAAQEASTELGGPCQVVLPTITAVERRWLSRAALLHDIEKLGVSNNLGR